MESGDKYRLIVESANDYAIFTIDTRNRITSWNKGAKKLLGYSKNEIFRKSGRKLFTPSDRRHKAPEHEISTALRCGRSEDERWHLRKNGTVFWGSGIMMPLRNSDGKLIGFLKILRDMTIHKLAESAQQRFRLLVQNIRDYAILLLDKEGKITEWNEGAERLKGYTQNDVIGRHFRLFYTQEDQRNKCPEHELRRASREGRSEVEGWRVRKDGSRFWTNEIITPIREGNGNIVGFAKISRDLTERREAEDALRMMNESLERRVQERTAEMEDYQTRLRAMALQLSKTQEEERQRIAANLHDNLAQLLALSEMRLSGLKKRIDDSQLTKSLSDVEKYIDQAIKYTRSLMIDLSPPVLQKRELLPAIQWLAHEMETHGLKTTIRDDGKPKPVSDEAFTILFQGVRELLFNVIKHADCNRATLSLKRNGPCVYVHVRDTGRGFDPHSSRQNDRAFGLFTLRERLRLIGGRIEIDSKPRAGTHVMICASLDERPQKGRIITSTELLDAQRDGEPSHAEKDPIRVLIVDDHKMMRDGLRKVLEEEPGIHIVAEAVDGSMAVSATTKYKPDVVLMDVNMPKVDGIEASRRITRLKNPPAVIGLSIHEDKQTEQSIRRAGACDYLSKRETADKLYSTIRRWAKNRSRWSKQKKLSSNKD